MKLKVETMNENTYILSYRGFVFTAQGVERIQGNAVWLDFTITNDQNDDVFEFSKRQDQLDNWYENEARLIELANNYIDSL